MMTRSQCPAQGMEIDPTHYVLLRMGLVYRQKGLPQSLAEPDLPLSGWRRRTKTITPT
jgi:hypothetical protein